MTMYFAEVDECVAGIHDCDDNSVCINTNSSYICECNAGYNMTSLQQCEGSSAILYWVFICDKILFGNFAVSFPIKLMC